MGYGEGGKQDGLHGVHGLIQSAWHHRPYLVLEILLRNRVTDLPGDLPGAAAPVTGATAPGKWPW